ncbi:hypothetical protein F8B43_5367 [Methylorubrum populi]|uniref:Uncharacterized protein n=1 Tax=Methylorubrum populi TaxID=223967 RepID=A0A833J2U8_9HYPH|nr:hypothetical protein F8B43_5367 [Methylorubrum populi]
MPARWISRNKKGPRGTLHAPPTGPVGLEIKPAPSVALPLR